MNQNFLLDTLNIRINKIIFISILHMVQVMKEHENGALKTTLLL